jgi:hypothetical protein
MTKQATLQGLFGTPIYESNLERPYTKEELILFENCKKTELSFPYLPFKKFWQLQVNHRKVNDSRTNI